MGFLCCLEWNNKQVGVVFVRFKNEDVAPPNWCAMRHTILPLLLLLLLLMKNWWIYVCVRAPHTHSVIEPEILSWLLLLVKFFHHHHYFVSFRRSFSFSARIRFTMLVYTFLYHLHIPSRQFMSILSHKVYVFYQFSLLCFFSLFARKLFCFLRCSTVVIKNRRQLLQAQTVKYD